MEMGSVKLVNGGTHRTETKIGAEKRAIATLAVRCRLEPEPEVEVDLVEVKRDGGIDSTYIF
jgi:hypothetical protein